MGCMPDLVRTVVRAVWADGGQRAARRNAWSAMVADSKRARERAEAAEMMAAALAAISPSPLAFDLEAGLSGQQAVGS